jgi:8-oxo-dGTP pyrophosphatase MutT (NUDIX family)
MSHEVGKGNGVLPWNTLSREEILDCRIFTVEKIRRESRSSGKAGDFYLIGSSDWVNVVAVTDDERMVLIRQYRQGADEITLEIPGGILDRDESPVDAARRELEEETGFIADELTLIGRVRPNPALFDNWTYTVLATGAKPSGSVALDEHEEIDVELVDIASIDDLLRTGAITHALVIDALMWYRLAGESRRRSRKGNGKRSTAG